MIKIIDIDLLVPFENHPFKERSGIEQQELIESIKENGVLEPIIVRPFPAGKYEIISGHRRVEACKALGITSIPVTIKERKIMTTETNDELITALYCRLSVEDEKDKRVSDDESNSISNQKQILLDYCKKHGYKNTMFFVDGGISGTSFERSDFQRM